MPSHRASDSDTLKSLRMWQCSSVVEQTVHTRSVAGSNPAIATIPCLSHKKPAISARPIRVKQRVGYEPQSHLCNRFGGVIEVTPRTYKKRLLSRKKRLLSRLSAFNHALNLHRHIGEQIVARGGFNLVNGRSVGCPAFGTDAIVIGHIDGNHSGICGYTCQS
jgi:hypothetical protein